MLAVDFSLLRGALVLAAVRLALPVYADAKRLTLDGHVLPRNFIYGCGTSAYQVEGAWNADGKGMSIWDVFAHGKGKGHIRGDQTGDIAMDFYHTYPRDISLFHRALGVNNYDFTLAWTRLLPTGKGKQVNESGLQFYKNMMRTVHENNMTATCTLYHWDLPHALQAEYKGWLSRNIVRDFENYAAVVMEALGNDCDRWLSMNEPRTFCTEGYGTEQVSAPGFEGTMLDTFKCMHHALLAHAASHRVFRTLKANNKFRGTFGIKIDGQVSLPLDPQSKADQAAAQRATDFEIGWVLAPLTKGNYPWVMRKTMGRKLPSFTPAEQRQLRNSYDVVWFDSYTRTYAAAIKGDCSESNSNARWPTCVRQTQERNGRPIGKPTGSGWNFQVKETIYSGLKYMHERWGVKDMAVGETGLSLFNRRNLTLGAQLNDHDRIEWYRNSLRDVKRALEEKIPLSGFVPWSCMSSLEWSGGYDGDFGLIFTTPGKNRKRYPKLSSMFLRDVMTNGEHTNSTRYDRGGSAHIRI